MNSLLFIAKNNLKKHKGEAVILFALIFMAAVLLYSSTALIMSGNNAVDEVIEKNNVSDLLLFAQPITEEEMQQGVESVDLTEKCETVPCIQLSPEYYYGDMAKEDASANIFYVFDSSRPTELNKFPEEFNNLKDDEIVIAYYLSSSIKTGDELHFTLGSKEYSFKVAGYVENLYFANARNISGIMAYVSHNTFEEFTDISEPVMMTYANAKENTDLHEYELAVQKAFPKDLSLVTVDRNTMVFSCVMLSDMASGIILVFTLTLVAMSVIIMHFSIKNFIELNIQNIGLLQATGYTAKELRFACVMEQMIIAVLATVAAVFVGIFISGPLNMLTGMLVGLKGFSGIAVPPLLATIIGIPVMVFLGSLIATTSYKKLTVLEALRSGITSHNFRKNHFPLEKSRLPLNLVMAGKNNMGSIKRSIFITLIVALLTMSTCEGFSMFQSWALDQSNILNMIGLEISDIQVPTYGDDALENEARKHGDVEKVNTWTTIQNAEVTYLENSETLGIDVYGDVNILNQETVIEGHLPANGNEIVLSVVESDRLEAKPGDVVNIKAVDGSFVAFTVSGIDQKFNNMGKKGLMTEEGALRINPDFAPEYTIIYLKDSSKAKNLKEEWEEKYPDYQFILFETFMSESINSIIMAMETICFIFVIATCFVVILTQLLLTRAQVIRERKNLGVSKALGYTSGELIRRTLMTNMPLIVIGILIGSAFHIAFSDKLTILALSSFGMREISASTDPVWFLVSALIIIVCAVVTALLSSRRIAKLEPSKILTEE